jgi:hypothetical protein
VPADGLAGDDMRNELSGGSGNDELCVHPRRRIAAEPDNRSTAHPIDRIQIEHAIKGIVKVMPTGFVLLLRSARWVA